MRIYARVFPKSFRQEVEKISEGEYRIRVTAPPEKGKANAQLIEMLANHFRVPKSSVVIAGGKTARIKMVDIML